MIIDEKIDEKLDEKLPSMSKKVLFILCGMKSLLNKSNNVNKISLQDTSIEEDPKWALVCDILAVLMLSFCGFSIAFFNKFN